ncbi:hypothetical protein [uncultured Rubinisphaera sp.]|uniref:hypothetical protein n=1 Tax=uncultured Rubinisphaera sp. TaxID=1678686 RepID=UPI0030DADF86|tara:strand:- start:491 stop:1015 length:525 start_codon:yes stop_codon:yes gene_type:complete
MFLEWYEPFFFRIAHYSSKQWKYRIISFLLIFATCSLLSIFEARNAITKLDIVKYYVFNPALFAFVFLIIYEIPSIRRHVVIYDKSITYESFLSYANGLHMLLCTNAVGQWTRIELEEVCIIIFDPPLKGANAQLIIKPKYGVSIKLAVPVSVSPDLVISAFKENQIPFSIVND